MLHIKAKKEKLLKWNNTRQFVRGRQVSPKRGIFSAKVQATTLVSLLRVPLPSKDRCVSSHTHTHTHTECLVHVSAHKAVHTKAPCNNLIALLGYMYTGTPLDVNSPGSRKKLV